MFNRLKIRSRILILALVSALGILFISANDALDKYGAATKMAQTAQLTELASDVSTLVHSLQREAAASAAFLSGNSQSATVLSELTRKSSEAQRKVGERLQTYDLAGASSELKAVLDDGLFKA